MKIIYRLHAVERMFGRDISVSDISKTLKSGKIIENYPEDKPYPSKLILGFVEDRPIHVVAAENKIDNELIVITVYEPDPQKWDANFERRIK